MSRNLRLLLAVGLSVGIVALTMTSPRVQSQPLQDKSKPASIEEKLDQILKRLERVEKRLDSIGAAPLGPMRRGALLDAGVRPFTAKLNNTTEILRTAAKPIPKATTFNKCRPEGEGDDGENNIRKNRVDASEEWLRIPYDVIHDLDWPKRIKKYRYSWSDEDRASIAEFEGAAISIEGYILKVKPEGAESCNCGKTTKNMIDYHLPLVKDKDGEEGDSIVVEVTPRIRDEHDSWDHKTIQRLADKGKKVRISGWLFFDPYHKNHLGRYRATLWEIHPIMEIEVYEKGSWIPLDEWDLEQTRLPSPYEWRQLPKAG